MRFRLSLYTGIHCVLLAMTGCDRGDVVTPEDIAPVTEKLPSAQTVSLDDSEASLPAVMAGTLVEFCGSEEMTDDDLERGRKFYLRIVRVKRDGTRVTCQSGNAVARESDTDGVRSFQHSLEVPQQPGQYLLEVKVGKRLVTTAELPVKPAKDR